MVNLLQENPEISVDHELVQNSIFYKAVQHATELDISDLNHFEFNGAGDYALNMEFLILTTKIAATSKTLYSIDASNNSLGEDALRFIQALSPLANLQILNLAYNQINNPTR